MRLGIYGGAFSPVHKSHVDIAKAFADKFSLDKLLIIPTGKAPHKDFNDGVEAGDRLEMCKLAFEGIPFAEVSDMEIRREGNSYTVLTLRELATAFDADLYMLVGSDKIRGLGRWFGADEIFKLCTIVYAPRKGNSDDIDSCLTEYTSRFGATIKKLDADVDGLSSERIREAISKGEDVSDKLPSKVVAFIKEKGLYLNKNEQ